MTAKPEFNYPDKFIESILKDVKSIAMIGASANEMRPSYFAMLYLLKKGYQVSPVNPRYVGKEIQGRKVYAGLSELPSPPDMVQIFRRSEDVPPIVDEAIVVGAKVIWMQLGVWNDEAAARAETAGLRVVQDRCPKIEYGRIFGEIGWLGVNRGVLSGKRGVTAQLKSKKGRLI